MSDPEKKLIERDQIANLVYNDEAYTKEFAQATVVSFTEFKVNYNKYLLKRDETNFRKAGHKIKPVAQMLNLDIIIDEYEHAKTLLWDEKSREELEKSANKITKICDQIIKDLEEIQEDPT